MAPHAQSPSHQGAQDSHATSDPSPCELGSAHSDQPRSFLRHTPSDELHDLICVGFGPASLAIAAALHDAIELRDPAFDFLAHQPPKVCFLEKQPRFAWHAGMQLPGAKMQITFVKDLATLRDPRSRFTFLNYLHAQNRLVQFTNLSTFLPLRAEYEDYMRWCARHFDDVSEYNQEAVSITPDCNSSPSGKTSSFTVRTRNLSTGQIESRRSRHVVIATGGRPKIPDCLPQHHPRVIPSAHFIWAVPAVLKDANAPYTIAVIGSGQSAAETFNDLHTRFPRSRTRLILKGAALKPSDDSPFVNEVFDPERIDPFYATSSEARAAAIAEARETNYGVVRLELLEHIYAEMYEQRLRHGDERDWPHRILPHRTVTSAEDVTGTKSECPLRLHIANRTPRHADGEQEVAEETLDVDACIVAVGYQRNVHEEILRPAQALMPEDAEHWEVERDYRVKFRPGAVAHDAGVWLQGCNEQTHGLSDTLLSVLATRGGEMVRSIFRERARPSKGANGMKNGATNGVNGVH